jgi:transmembrane sensor
MPADLVARMRGTLARDKGRLAPPAPQPSRRRFLSGPAYAAVAAMAVGGAGHLAWRHMQAQPVHTQSLRTERGQRMEARMADGSLLRLDTATRLDVAYYRHRREVRLQDGQAVFEVQTDADRPFHVLAGPVRVTVVGTRFSVRYTPGLPGNAGVQVAVEAGRVRVAPLAPGEAGLGRYDLLAGTLLGAGEQIAANEQGEPGPVTAVPPDGIAPWREQRVSFVDVPLGQALAELERYHPTGLMVRDPRAAALRLSGTFDPMATDALRKALPRVLPVRLQAQDGRIEVLPAR